MFWYHILLPYTFLANTSHNKDLIIDDGWTNTFRNTFGFLNNIRELSENFITQYTSNGNICAIHEVNENGDTISKVQRVGDIEQEMSRNIKYVQKPEVTSEIPTISKSVKMIDALKTENTINVPDYLPSTSKREVVNSDDSKLKKLTSESDEDDLIPQRSHYLIMGETILSYMMLCVNDETKYLHYLTELSKFNEVSRQGSNTINGFEISHITVCRASKKNRVKNSLSEITSRRGINRDTGSKTQPKLNNM